MARFKKYLAYFMLIALFLFFALYPPIALYDSFTCLAIVEGAILGLVLLLIMSGIKSFNQIYFFDSDELPNLEKLRTKLFPLFFTIASSLALFNIHEWQLNNLLQKDGVITTAKIEMGEHVVGHISLIPIDRCIIRLNIDLGDKYLSERKVISGSEFKKLREGMIINVVYLKSNYNVFKLLVSDENIQRFSKKGSAIFQEEEVSSESTK